MFSTNCFSIVFCFFHISLDRFVFFAIIYIWFLVLHGAIWRVQSPCTWEVKTKTKAMCQLLQAQLCFEVMIALEANLCQARSRPQMWQNDVSWFFFVMPWQMPTHPALFMASGWTGWRISWWYENLVTCRRNLVQSIWLQNDQSQSERRQLKAFPVLTRVFAQRVLFEAVWSWQTTYLVHSCVVWSQGRDVWLSNLEGCRVILLDRCLAQHPNSIDLEASYQ